MRRALLSIMGGLLAGMSWGCCPAEDSPPAATETELTEALMPTPDPQVKPDEVSPEAKRLLAIATDPKQDYQDRVRAVYDLSEFREPGVVTPLLRMLPGRNDALTHQVVDTLSVIGDPRAIDALEKMLDHPTIEYEGKIRAAISSAIESCKRNRVPGGP
jgi:HEAT repeat protein